MRYFLRKNNTRRWYVRFLSCTTFAGSNLPVIELPVMEIAVIELPLMEIPVMEIPVMEIAVMEIAVIEFRKMSRFMMTVTTFLEMVVMTPSLGITVVDKYIIQITKVSPYISLSSFYISSSLPFLYEFYRYQTKCTQILSIMVLIYSRIKMSCNG